MGVDFRGKSVLDVGAGSGRYTLEVAREAGRVVAIDVSDEMLRLSAQDAARLGVGNVEYAVSAWEDYPEGEAFDFVLCMMSPAARDDRSRERLFSHAREAVVLTGFSRYSPPPALAEILARRGREPARFRNGPEMREFLDRTSRRYEWELREGVWSVAYTRGSFARIIADHLDDYGIEPEPGEIEAFADALAPPGGGEFVAEIPYAVEIIVARAG
jgi:SAM-dependent methyltransferase